MVTAMPLAENNFVHEIDGSVSLPDIVLRVNRMVDSDSYSAEDIGMVLSNDPGLCDRLIKFANSPMYESGHEITSIEYAIAFLGTIQIRELVLITAITRMFTGAHNNTFSVDEFWRHSLYCGLLARSFAGVTRKINPEIMFSAGLLHNIGRLIINNLPGETTGVTHARMGASHAEYWQLPSVLTECIACHHEPEQARQFPEAVAHIYIANKIASLPEECIPDQQELTAVIEPGAWKMSGLKVSDIEGCVLNARELLAETRELLFGD